MFDDNQGAIELAANPLSFARSKYIDVRVLLSGPGSGLVGYS